jgi:hypothetical protein
MWKMGADDEREFWDLGQNYYFVPHGTGPWAKQKKKTFPRWYI